MKSRRVQVSEQILKFVQQLASQPKKRIRVALRELAILKGDIKELESPLDGYNRLRIAQFRVIFKVNEASVDCIFIERRSIVYEVFEKILLDE
jgi:mRNA-degrading endonuclease RelE of RelBE toxin-antitoxin system